MLCTKPYTGRGTVFGCGQCKCCRINRSRQKAARQILESYCHEESCFITLTYNDKHLPKDYSLKPLEMKLWMYRIRKMLGELNPPVRVRFCLVGEYGHDGVRFINPHYHANVFGVGPFTPIRGEYFLQALSRTWSYGFVTCAPFTPERASYVAGYIVKKLTDRLRPELSMLQPEFSRASNRPGLGAPFMSMVASSLKAWMKGRIDIPRELKIGSRSVPLDRYLLAKLRDAVGMSGQEIQNAKDQESYQRSLELRFLLEEAQKTAPHGLATSTDVYFQENGQKIKQRLHRYEIWQSKRAL